MDWAAAPGACLFVSLACRCRTHSSTLSTGTGAPAASRSGSPISPRSAGSRMGCSLCCLCRALVRRASPGTPGAARPPISANRSLVRRRLSTNELPCTRPDMMRTASTGSACPRSEDRGAAPASTARPAACGGAPRPRRAGLSAAPSAAGVFCAGGSSRGQEPAAPTSFGGMRLVHVAASAYIRTTVPMHRSFFRSCRLISASAHTADRIEGRG